MPPRHWARASALLSIAAATGALTCATVGVPDAPAALSLSALGTALFLSLLAFGFGSLRRAPLRAALGLGRSSLGGVTVLVLVAGTLCLSQMLDSIIQLVGADQGGVLQELEASLAGARGTPLLLALVGIGLAPGLGEELFFRGLIQRGLLARLGGAGAVVAAALLFGAAHGDPVHAAAASVLGLYLGAVALLAASTRAAAVCHVVNNCAAVLTAAWELDWPSAAHLPVAVVSGAAAALALQYALRRVAEASPARPIDPDTAAPPGGTC